jgi:sulfate transport system permease protein
MSAAAGKASAASRAPDRPWGRWGLRSTAIAYLVLAVALPLAAVVERGFGAGLAEFWRQVTAPTALESLRLTLFLAAVMTAVNAVFGIITAYVLARYEFPGRGLFNGLVDLPFAIPTLVTGVMLVVLYGPQGALGGWFEARGVPIIFAKPGILLALLFVCYPFVVRAVQPLFLGAEKTAEEAAWTLGASRWTTFWRITLPEILPGVLTGALLCFARALGEFGSIVVVAGNIPGRTLTAPVYIFGEIESQNSRGASAVSIVLLTISFGMLFTMDWFGRRQRAARG